MGGVLGSPARALRRRSRGMAPRPVRFSVRLGARGVPSRLEGSALYVLAARGAHRLRTGEAPVQSRGARWAEPLVLMLTIYEAPDGTLEEKHIALTLVEAAGRGNEERLGTYKWAQHGTKLVTKTSKDLKNMLRRLPKIFLDPMGPPRKIDLKHIFCARV